jgi:hypothetical protein
MRRLVFALIGAVLAALILVRTWGSEPIEQRLVGVQIEALMPGYAEALRTEPLEVQAAMLLLALDDPMLAARAQLALQRHGGLARPVLAAYAADPGFRLVLDEYGEHVVPPIHFFMHNGLPSLAVYKWAGDTADAFRRRWGGAEDAAPVALTAEERGRFAIRFIAKDGHDFLGQFIVGNDGMVSRVQTERLTEGLIGFFTGGVRNLETRVRRGDELRLSDAGWAAVDVALAASALKVLRVGRGAAAQSSAVVAEPAMAAIGTTLLRGSRMGTQVARFGGPVALVYIVVRHPSLLNSAFARAAELLGYPAWVVQGLGWVLVLLPVLLLLQWLLCPLGWMLAGTAALVRWCDCRLCGRRPARAVP